mmetsp:Transcript_25453/g.35861  ORF Transcript_25453/g.35861 Transcript_25453/m.35861 type:complete len:82 (+) Transcript_25453:1-246(+)
MVAYMLKASAAADKHLPLSKALEHVDNKKKGSKPRDNFMQELAAFEFQLYEDSSVGYKPKKAGGGFKRGKGGRGGKGKRGK